MADLSIVIPARCEEYLARTVQDIHEHARGDYEIIAVLDGEWAEPALPDHPRLHIVKTGQSIGQRAATNLGVKLSTAKYVMKADAHVSFDEGFDVKLIADAATVGDDTTIIPAMLNLHVFDRICLACGHRMYQGPSNETCDGCKQAAGFDREIVWRPRTNRRTEWYRFDWDLHFYYWNDYKRRPEAAGQVADLMSAIGCCFFMSRERFWQLGGLDEAAGSWGGFGSEVALKSWLSGGRHVISKNTWISHAFRTQGGDWSFPYPNPQSAVEKAREHNRQVWLTNRWPSQVRPLSWLIEKFAPVPGWHSPADDETDHKLPPERRQKIRQLREERLRMVEAEGKKFTRRETRTSEPPAPRVTVAPRKALVYYSDSRLDSTIASTVRTQLLRAAEGLPIVSVTLEPLAFGHNVHFRGERSIETMFRQILAGLEATDADVVFLVEHDCLMAPEHFQFTPPTSDAYYYNEHRWQVRASDGFAVHYLAKQVSGCVASRELLLQHYRTRIAYIEAHGWDRNLGYEPGSNRRIRELDAHGAEAFFTERPNIDIRHDRNLSKSKWAVADFRDKRNARGWREADVIPGWGRTRGRFNEFLADVAVGRTDETASASEAAGVTHEHEVRG